MLQPLETGCKCNVHETKDMRRSEDVLDVY